MKREALDELVLRVMESIRAVVPPITLPICVFNGGRDAWLDVGNKKVGVEALQAYFGLDNHQCLHVGDQFLNTGNDLAARETCPCIWITSPRETEKILEHILKFMSISTTSTSRTRTDSRPRTKSGIESGNETGGEVGTGTVGEKVRIESEKSQKSGSFNVYTGEKE